MASHKFRRASAAWRHREGSVSAATTYPSTVIRRSEVEGEGRVEVGVGDGDVGVGGFEGEGEG